MLIRLHWTQTQSGADAIAAGDVTIYSTDVTPGVRQIVTWDLAGSEAVPAESCPM